MTHPVPLQLGRLRTPIGDLHACVVDGVLHALDWDLARVQAVARRQAGHNVACVSTALSAPVSAPLERYFEGDLDALRALRAAPDGTPFQRCVWHALLELRPGEAISYRELAARVGNPQAMRAVGRANASNPIALVVPCHRVIGAGGALTGYAGGLQRKRWLLEHEGALR